jgi:hypothetical protein
VLIATAADFKIINARFGTGAGDVPVRSSGFGYVYSKNITPAGVGTGLTVNCSAPLPKVLTKTASRCFMTYLVYGK